MHLRRASSELIKQALFFLSLSAATATGFAANTIHIPADQPTIQAGINAASSGDTILVAPGTYYENLTIDTKEIILTSEAGAATTVLDGATKASVVTILNTPSLATTINGFTLQNGKPAYWNIIAGGIYMSHAGATISNNIFGNNGGQVWVQGGSAIISSNHISSAPFGTPACSNGNDDVIQLYGVSSLVDGTGTPIPTQILGNTIEGDGTLCSGLAIRGNAGVLTVANNIIRGNSFGISAYPTGLIIRQNLIYNNVGGGIFIEHPATSVPAADPPDFFVINNTIVDNSPRVNPQDIGGEIGLYGPYARIAFVNNIIVGNSSVPLILCFPGSAGGNYTPVIFDHNDIYDVTSPITNGNCPATTGVNGNISADPRFAGPTDLHITTGSPAIDTGNNSAPNLALTVLANNPRIQDSTGNGYPVVDMGAYESTGLEDSATTVLSLISSAYYLSPGTITLTASLRPASSPTSTVSFYQNGSFLSSEVLSSTTPATTTVSLPNPGLYSFTATLAPISGSSPAVSVVIYVYVAGTSTRGPTNTTLATSSNPANVSQPVTLKAAVTTSSSSIATGTVTFYDGSSSLGTFPLDATGNATYTTATLIAGSHLLHAVYSGDTNFTTSTSNTVSEAIQPIPTSTTLTVAPTPASAFQFFTVTVQVASLTATPLSAQPCAPNCTVTITIAGLPPNIPATATFPVLANGTVTAKYAFAAGTYTFNATFSGSPSFAASSATPIQQTVIPAVTLLSLAATPNPSIQHQTVTLNATIAAPTSTEIPGGLLTFLDGTTPIASAPFNANPRLNSTTAAISTSTLAPGTHTITVVYAGDPNFSPATASVVVTINQLDLALTTPDTSITIETTHHAPVTINLASLGDFQDKVDLTCANIPIYASCTFKPAAATLAPGTSATSILTLDTDEVPGYARNNAAPRIGGRTSSPIAFALLFPALLLLRRRRLPQRLLLIALTTVISALALSGCSGHLPSSTPPGTYTITITGNAAATTLTHSVQLTLIVTPLSK